MDGMGKKIILRAAELLEQGWTQRESARNERDEACWASSPMAVAWCMTGELDRAQRELAGTATHQALTLDQVNTARDILRVVAAPLRGQVHCGPDVARETSDRDVIALWNDSFERTADEAVQHLRKTAETLP